VTAHIGVTFIGPSGDAMRKLGDKIGSKLIAEEVGVPVAPWSRAASTPWRTPWRPPTDRLPPDAQGDRRAAAAAGSAR
jgi:biotin carboxylase